MFAPSHVLLVCDPRLYCLQPKCCGVTNYTDWENNGITIPQSCCKHGSPCDVSDPTQLYPEVIYRHVSIDTVGND